MLFRSELLRKVEQMALAMQELRDIDDDPLSLDTFHAKGKMLESAGAMLRDMSEAVQDPAAYKLANELRCISRELYLKHQEHGGQSLESSGSVHNVATEILDRRKADGADVLRQELAALKSFQDPVLERIADAALKLLDPLSSKT